MKFKTARRQRWVVSAVECGGQGRRRECGVLARTEEEARRKAVARWYGASALWWADNGLGDNYGQVVGAGGNCLTDRVRIDAAPYSTTVRHAADGLDWQAL